MVAFTVLLSSALTLSADSYGPDVTLSHRRSDHIARRALWQVHGYRSIRSWVQRNSRLVMLAFVRSCLCSLWHQRAPYSGMPRPTACRVPPAAGEYRSRLVDMARPVHRPGRSAMKPRRAGYLNVSPFTHKEASCPLTFLFCLFSLRRPWFCSLLPDLMWHSSLQREFPRVGGLRYGLLPVFHWPYLLIQSLLLPGLRQS